MEPELSDIESGSEYGRVETWPHGRRQSTMHGRGCYTRWGKQPLITCPCSQGTICKPVATESPAGGYPVDAELTRQGCRASLYTMRRSLHRPCWSWQGGGGSSVS